MNERDLADQFDRLAATIPTTDAASLEQVRHRAASRRHRRKTGHVLGSLAGLALLVVGVAQVLAIVDERPPAPQIGEPDGTGADAEAERMCRGPGLEYALGYDPQSELAASHPTTAGQLQRWQRDRHKPDGPVPDVDLRAASSDSFVAVCQYEGNYVGFPQGPPAPSGDAPEPDPYRYLTVTVTDEPTESHPVGDEGEPDPVLLFSVSPDFDPEHPPPPDERKAVTENGENRAVRRGFRGGGDRI